MIHEIQQMRLVLTSVMIFIFITVHPQNPATYALWEDQNTSIYYFAGIDPATGVKTNLFALTGLTGLVIPGTTVIDPNQDEYIFIGLFGSAIMISRIQISSGNLFTVPMPDNLFGLQYNCKDGNFYCLWEDNNTYMFISVNPDDGTKTVLDTLPGINGHIGGTFALSSDSGTYSCRVLAGASYKLLNIDIASGSIKHNNPFPENGTGMEFDCQNDTLYGLWNDTSSSSYWLTAVDPKTGNYFKLGQLIGVDGMISETHSLDPSTGLYSFLGFSGPAATIFTVNVHLKSLVNALPVNGFTNAAGFETASCCGCPVPGPVANFSFTATGLTAVFSNLSSASNEFNWSFGDSSSDTSANPSHAYLSPGSWFVCLNSSNFCESDTFCDSVTVSNPVSREELTAGFEFYPNPADEFLSLKIPADLRGKYYSISDMNGRRIIEGNLPPDELNIGLDAGNFPAGSYIFELHAQNRIHFLFLKL